MGINKKQRELEAKAKAKKLRIVKFGSIVGCLLLVGVIVASNLKGTDSTVYAQGIEIDKNEVGESGIKVYPYSVDGLDLEVLAVKSSDGSIRTAFNTCQVCYSSGRGYYKIEGNNLVCQNCGNTFTFDQVGLESGGCNPVPITSTNEVEDNSTIKISDDYIKQNVALFQTWKD